MRVFLDTNVLLDTLLPGRSLREVSNTILTLGNIDPLRFCVSTLTLANLAYSARKMYSKQEVRELLNNFKGYTALEVLTPQEFLSKISA